MSKSQLRTLSQIVFSKPVLIIYFLALICLLFNLWATYHIRPFNSDDVAWQNQMLTWRPFNGRIAAQGSTAPFVDKIPFYILMGNLFSPSRRLLLVDSAILEVLGFTFFYLSGLYFIYTRSKNIDFASLLPFLWMASLGFYFAQLYLNSNWRGFDVGVSFLTFALAAWFFHREAVTKTPKSWIICIPIAALLAGIMTYSDPHFLYFTIAPLFLLTIWLLITRVINRRHALAAFAAFILTGVFTELVKHASEMAGIKVVTTYPSQFIPYDQFFSNIALTIQSLLTITGANFFGDKLLSQGAISGVLDLVVLVAILVIVYGAYKSFIVRHFVETEFNRLWIIFFGGLIIEVIGLYTFSTLANANAYRYFLIFLLSGIMLLSLLISTSVKSLRYVASVILVAGIIANLALSIDNGAYFAPASNRANSLNYEIIDALQRSHLKKGYSNYWEASINTYLSGNKVLVLPTLCSEVGKATPYHWLIDQSRFAAKAERTFYILDPDIIDPANCTLDQLYRQFGQPAQTKNVADKTVLIFNYDIGQRMPPGPF